MHGIWDWGYLKNLNVQSSNCRQHEGMLEAFGESFRKRLHRMKLLPTGEKGKASLSTGHPLDRSPSLSTTNIDDTICDRVANSL